MWTCESWCDLRDLSPDLSPAVLSEHLGPVAQLKMSKLFWFLFPHWFDLIWFSIWCPWLFKLLFSISSSSICVWFLKQLFESVSVLCVQAWACICVTIQLFTLSVAFLVDLNMAQSKFQLLLLALRHVTGFSVHWRLCRPLTFSIKNALFINIASPPKVRQSSSFSHQCTSSTEDKLRD